MKLTPTHLETLCDAAIQAAKAAGTMIQQRANTNFKVDHKEIGSTPASQVVTEVDIKSQEIILKHINPTLEPYQLGLLSEEEPDDGSRFEQDYFWCIDPMDGTLPFVERRPGYCVSIALVSREGQAVLGVIYDPLTETLYHAIKSGGAFLNQKPWVWKPNSEGPTQLFLDGGGVMNVIWALEQSPAYYLKKPKPQEGCGCLWDYAATACLYEELGAPYSNSHGGPLGLNSRESLFMNIKGVLFCSDADIQKQVIRETR